MRASAAITALLVLASGCADRTAPPAPAGEGEGVSAEATPPFRLIDVTASSGIEFVHDNDASDQRLLPETMGAGVALFDFDDDGPPDVYLVNGGALRGDDEGNSSGALYRNLGGGRFEDVTNRAGLRDGIFGMGAAVGDVDNDGLVDLLVTGVGGDRLYRNRGDATFEDVTERMGLVDRGFGSSAAFVDFDRDGWLDLFVGRYVEWSVETDLPCFEATGERVYCTPERYDGQSNRLYRNIRGERFEDVTRAAGVLRPDGKTLGVVTIDHNRDGWPDLAVSNDTVRNFLFVNNRDGTFSESGVLARMAYSESGSTRGGMGIDAADADGDGRDDLVIGNFSQEMSAFYRGHPNGMYVDDAAPAGIGIPTLLPMTWGVLFEDLDGDGRLDLLLANGHLEPNIASLRRSQRYEQFPQLFRNEGDGRFTPAAREGVAALGAPLVGRGLAAADLDGDGDLDFVVTQNGRAARVWRNDAEPPAWIRVRLVTAGGCATPYGAVVRLVAGGDTRSRVLRSGRSYLSACEPVLTFALDAGVSPERLEIAWPSGATQIVDGPAVNATLTIREGLP